MTGFKVEPGDIEGFGKLVGRAAEDVTAAITYLGENAKLDGKGAVGEFWELVTTEHDDYVSSGRSVLDKLQGVLDAAEGELTKSAQYYRETDRDEAASMDATYPGSKRPGKGDTQEKGNAAFDDAQDATSLLKAPSEPSGYLGGHAAEFQFSPVSKSFGTLLDFGSPSALVNEGFKLVLGIDPMGEVLKKVTGDWDTYTQCGQAWAALGAFCGALAENVSKGNNTLEASWDGNSADAAWVYFDELSNKIAELEDSFTNLRGNYDSIAHIIFAVAEFLKAGLAYLADRAIIWMTLNAAAMAASATGVGAFAGAASAALAAAQALLMVMKWAEMTAQFTKVALALNGVLLAGSTIVAGIQGLLQDFPEVGGDYDHQAV